jgi:hypothetical protein
LLTPRTTARSIWIMAKKNKNNNKSANNNNRTQSQRTRRSAANTNPTQTTISQWFTLKEKPIIKKDQTVYNWPRALKTASLVGMQRYVDTYQMVDIISISARVKPTYTHQSGTVALLVLTPEMDSLMTVPSPAPHSWMQNNGCTTGQMIRRVSSPPSNNPKAMRMTRATDTDLTFGSLLWSFEGPSSAVDLDHCGEIEVYVVANFFGLK